jgi:hypothetical protein
MSKSTSNSFAALAYDSDSDSESAPVASREEAIQIAYEKAMTAMRTIPVFPPGGVNLLEMFPDMAEMERCMRRGMSWYDMFYYEEDLAKYRKMREHERKYGPAEIIEEDAWTCVTQVKHKNKGHSQTQRKTKSYGKQRR